MLLRLRSHVENDGFHLAEQIDRNTGQQKSAKVTLKSRICSDDRQLFALHVFRT